MLTQACVHALVHVFILSSLQFHCNKRKCYAPQNDGLRDCLQKLFDFTTAGVANFEANADEVFKRYQKCMSDETCSDAAPQAIQRNALVYLAVALSILLLFV
jgi:hypothetical protein